MLLISSVMPALLFLYWITLLSIFILLCLPVIREQKWGMGKTLKINEQELIMNILTDNKLYWEDLAQNYALPELFLEKYIDYLDIILIIKNQKLSKKFIIRHKEKLYKHINLLICFQNITPRFSKELMNPIN